MQLMGGNQVYCEIDIIKTISDKEDNLKNFRIIKATILAAFCFSLLIEGCSKDENPAESQEQTPLVGNWKITHMTSDYRGEIETLSESQLDSMGLIWTFKIEKDGTMETTTNISGPVVTMPGTWSTSENQLTMTLTGPTGEDGTLVYDYIIEGNILKLNWEIPAGTKFYAEYTRQ